MGFIKKNLVLTVLIFISLLAFVAGAYLTYAESAKVSSAQKKINSAEAQLKGLLNANPAPSAENVTASEENVAALTNELARIREDLQHGSRISTSKDGVGVMASIQQYISEYQRRVASLTDENGEPAPIETPNDFAFGFEKYIKEAQPPRDEAVITTLDKQRQILSYIVNKLIDAQPISITSVQRELLEVKAAKDGKPGDKAGFTISPAISARVPGAIDTMAYSVTFTGYTESLKVFLNSLAQFDLPIVVRSVEVGRLQSGASSATKAKPKNSSLDDIFGAFGGASSAKPAAVEEPSQKPVFEDNVSSYTVVLEFIEIIIPSNSEENPS